MGMIVRMVNVAAMLVSGTACLLTSVHSETLPHSGFFIALNGSLAVINGAFIFTKGRK